MELNKKAIMFTFLSVMIAALFSTMFTATKQSPVDEKVNFANTQIRVLNEHVENFESYVLRSLEISGYTALQGMIQYIEDTSTFYSDTGDINNSYKNCVQTGFIDGTSTDCPFMTDIDDKTVPSLLDLVAALFLDELNIDLTYSVLDIGIEQIGSFELKTWINITYNADHSYAKWSQPNERLETTISIVGLEDPIYNSYGPAKGIASNTFKKTTITKWNNSATLDFLNAQDYRTFPGVINIDDGAGGSTDYLAMSFMERLTDTTMDKFAAYRIESFIRPQDVSPDDNTSYVDFVFLKNVDWICDFGNPTSLYTITGFGSEFILDFIHLATPPYNLTRSDWLNNGVC
jgi:hypothetical protein